MWPRVNLAQRTQGALSKRERITLFIPNPHTLLIELKPNMTWNCTWCIIECMAGSTEQLRTSENIITDDCTCLWLHRKVRLALQDAIDQPGAVAICGVIGICSCDFYHWSTWRESHDLDYFWILHRSQSKIHLPSTFTTKTRERTSTRLFFRL